MYPILQEIKQVVSHLRDHGMRSRRYASMYICNFRLISPLQSKYSSRQPLTQVNTDLPLITSSHPFPSDTRATSSVVSTHASQGPTDPQAYDTCFKLPVLRSDHPRGTAPNYLHPTSVSIIKPPPSSWTNSTYKVSCSHADQPAVGCTRAEPHAAVPSTGSHVFGREAGQVTIIPLS